jgi:DNA uptake protein ComE-like DNA-binding protein
LHKIYGIDSLFYSNVIKYIKFEKEPNVIVQQSKPEVLSIEINGADSTKLVRLKGIGSVYAMRIIKYRNLLGGFYSKEQLLEVYNFPEETFYEIGPHIYIDTTLIKKIRINFAEYTDLLRHPYLNKTQTESILNYRNKNGIFNDITQIQSIESIDIETFVKLRHYFTCR